MDSSKRLTQPSRVGSLPVSVLDLEAAASRSDAAFTESYASSHIGFDNHIRQQGATGRKQSLLRRGANLTRVVINPDKFPTEKIINMLDIEKIQLLQKQFENIAKEDETSREAVP